MQIPSSLKIGAHVYQIIRDDDSSEHENLFGLCLPRRLKIYIDPKVAQSQQEETLIHEALHAICDQVRAFPKTEGGHDEEERIVQALGHGIYQMLKENNLLNDNLIYGYEMPKMSKED